MKKLFLTSYAVVTLDLVLPLLTKLPHASKVAFIPNAADPYEDKTFLELDRNKLIAMGFNLIEVDLKTLRGTELEKTLQDCDVIFVAGGNTFCLLDQMQRSGCVDLIKKRVAAGVLYIGSSAGSAVCCPTIEYVREFDDPAAAPNLTDYTGLDLISEILLPHAHKEKYFERMARARAEMEAKGFKVISLTDDQVFVVTDAGSEVKSI